MKKLIALSALLCSLLILAPIVQAHKPNNVPSEYSKRTRSCFSLVYGDPCTNSLRHASSYKGPKKNRFKADLSPRIGIRIKTKNHQHPL
jgi:hypothetical protein